MVYRHFDYLAQRPAGQPVPTCRPLPAGVAGPTGTFTFDLEEVAAAGIAELIETCSSTGPMAGLVEMLTASNPQGLHVWRGNGPGTGKEMRNAFSGIFGRFFTRAYLEAHGYAWFHSISAPEEHVAGDIYVLQAGPGDMADWVCAKDGDAATQGEIIIAEGKGRHRNCHLRPAPLPSVLQKALTQIQNTYVARRIGPGVPDVPIETKAWAVLLRWANEHRSGRPLLRVLDPLTNGERSWTDEEKQESVISIAQSNLMALLSGLGLPELAARVSPLDHAEDVEVLKKMAELAITSTSRRRAKLRLVDNSDYSEEEAVDIGVTAPDVEYDGGDRVLMESVQKQLASLRHEERPPIHGRHIRSENPVDHVHTVSIASHEFGVSRYVGSVFGASGRVNTQLPDIVKHASLLPEELKRQLLFVGIAEEAIECAIAGKRVPRPVSSDKARQAVRADSIYVTRNGMVVAPLSRLRADTKERSF